MENRSIEVNALDRFRDNLNLFINHHMENHIGKDWRSSILVEINYKPIIESKTLDLPPLVEIFHSYWDTVFRNKIPTSFPKAVLTIIKYFRNCSAHQQSLNTRELYRMLDLMCWTVDEMQLHDSVLNDMRVKVLLKLAEEEGSQASRIDFSSPHIRNENSVPSSNQFRAPTRSDFSSRDVSSSSQSREYSSLYQAQAREMNQSRQSPSYSQPRTVPSREYREDYTQYQNHTSSSIPLSRVMSQLGSTC